MNKVLWILVALPLSVSYAKAQGNRTSADSLYRAGAVKESIAAYKKNYLMDTSDAYSIYNLACALSQDRQIDSGFK